MASLKLNILIKMTRRMENMRHMRRTALRLKRKVLLKKVWRRESGKSLKEGISLKQQFIKMEK
jgi:hypothetical protein